MWSHRPHRRRGTGSYGAGLARYLTAHGYAVFEVDRPDRRTRRTKGKSDPIDAEAAARTVLAGKATGVPKSGDGVVEMVRTLRICRRSAIRARTQAMNQMHAVVLTAPQELRSRLERVAAGDLVDHLVRTRSRVPSTPASAVLLALGELALRHRFLSAQIERLDTDLEVLTAEAAPRLLALYGVGPEVAGALLVTAGDNPERLRSESSFAHLCGVAPVPASSGKTTRHRLNRGGDRAANHALWRIVMVRLAHHEPTKAYMARRRSEGLGKKETIRCLKRYVAREVYRALLDE
jgi:transposase